MKDSSTFFESNKNSDEEKPVQNLKMKDIAKLHKNSFHKSKEKLEKLLKASQYLNQETKRLISRVVDNCKICKLFKKTPSIPKAAFPKAYSFNEIVSFDLKEMKDKGIYVFYMMDEFTKYMKGRIIKSKAP